MFENVGDYMRHIHVEDGLSLRFPGRDEEFNEGVEIGIVAARMSTGQSCFTARVSLANIEQASSLAEKMGYRLILGPTQDTSAQVIFRTGPARPRLTLVHSRQHSGQNAVL